MENKTVMDKPLFLKTLSGEPCSRPPIWYMRQAGRILPSYIELKSRHTFWNMMKDPELGARVTLLPVHDLGVDAAILFSDILVVPYAMGMGLDFTDHGPVFERALAGRDNPIRDLNPDPARLEYIYRVISSVRDQKPPHIPLIGFCGGPLTVLCYMLEGLGKKAEFPEAVKFIYSRRKDTVVLIDMLMEMTIRYIRGQARHGIDVFQLFETHAGIIPFELYRELFLPAVKRVAGELRELKIPFIYFPKDIGAGLAEITPDYCDFVSVDWQTPLRLARKMVDPRVGLQGNIDPRLLFMEKQEIEKALENYVLFGREHQDWIINLGHGFKPGIPYENARFMTDYLKAADWQRG
jgi:uroporphyrinogen decarboxylase